MWTKYMRTGPIMRINSKAGYYLIGKVDSANYTGQPNPG